MSISRKVRYGIAGALVAALSISAPAAEAGGLFGKRGVFRGSVGKFLDRHVEKPVLTPVARTGTVVGGAVAGAIGAMMIGAPPSVGAAVGAEAGRAVNNLAAGQRP